MRGDPGGLRMPRATLERFRNYSGSFYARLNSYLRNGRLSYGHTEPDLEDAIRAMDKGMVSIPGRRPVQMWRGMPSSSVERVTGVAVQDIQAGQVLTEGAYMSVSGDIRVAESFGNVIFDLRVPPGVKGRFMGYNPGGPSVSNLPHEAESLLQRGCTIVARGRARRIPSPSGYGSDVWVIRADLYPPPVTAP
jgi:hypothetical protein